MIPRGRVVFVAYQVVMPRLLDPVAGTDARWVRVGDVLDRGLGLAFDHRSIVADGVECVRRKLEDTALATAFCGPVFTMSELQQGYVAVCGIALDPRNFSRKPQGTRGFVVPPTTRRRARGVPRACSVPNQH